MLEIFKIPSLRKFEDPFLHVITQNVSPTPFSPLYLFTAFSGRLLLLNVNVNSIFGEKTVVAFYGGISVSRSSAPSRGRLEIEVDAYQVASSRPRGDSSRTPGASKAIHTSSGDKRD